METLKQTTEQPQEQPTEAVKTKPRGTAKQKQKEEQATEPQQEQKYLTTSVLISIQQELKVPKNNFNSFGKYKYRSAEDILETVKPILAKYHSTILLQDEVKEVCGVPYITCTAQIITPLGVFQTTASAGIDVNKKGMDAAQCFGSSISYARKYALGGLLLIDDTKDSDATNQHTDKHVEVSEKQLPVLTDEKFGQLLDRYNKGEKDIFNKATKHFSFTSAQSGIINKLSQ
jgi:hypothetical protein